MGPLSPRQNKQGGNPSGNPWLNGIMAGDTVKKKPLNHSVLRERGREREKEGWRVGERVRESRPAWLHPPQCVCVFPPCHTHTHTGPADHLTPETTGDTHEETPASFFKPATHHATAGRLIKSHSLARPHSLSLCQRRRRGGEEWSHLARLPGRKHTTARTSCHHHHPQQRRLLVSNVSRRAVMDVAALCWRSAVTRPPPAHFPTSSSRRKTD